MIKIWLLPIQKLQSAHFPYQRKWSSPILDFNFEANLANLRVAAKVRTDRTQLK